MKFEIINATRALNVVRFKYIFLGLAVIAIIFKFSVHYKEYKTYLHHRVEVFYNSGKNPYQSGRTYKFSDFDNSNIKIPNGELDVRPQVTYTIKAKTYLQYFILDFNPNEKIWFTFYFLFNYLIIASIVFYALRKSNKEKIFTKELLTGLSYLRVYLIIMMVMKILQIFLFEDYVEKISNLKASFYLTHFADIATYQIYLLMAAIIITFVKEGLRLQMEQDLTV